MAKHSRGYPCCYNMTQIGAILWCVTEHCLITQKLWYWSPSVLEAGHWSMAGPSLVCSYPHLSIYRSLPQSSLCHSALKGVDGKQRRLQLNVMTTWQETAPAAHEFSGVCLLLYSSLWSQGRGFNHSQINCSIIVTAEPLLAKTRLHTVIEGKLGPPLFTSQTGKGVEDGELFILDTNV